MASGAGGWSAWRCGLAAEAAMASSSGSEMDGSDMGEFLDDFASESDDGDALF